MRSFVCLSLTLWVICSTLRCKADEEQLAPELQPINVPKQIRSGLTIRIICSAVSGSLPMTFEWYRNGALTDRSDIQTESTFDYHSVLVFKPASIDHNGHYSCTAKNKAGSSSSEFDIQVNGKSFHLKKKMKKNKQFF
jgi:hypothetical protein